MAQRTGIVTAGTLNIRPEPSTRRPPVGSVRRGDRLPILALQGNWYRVPWNGREGYVHADYLREEEPPLAPGFLHEQAALAQSPLAPEPSARIPLKPGMPGRQRAAAQTWNGYGGLLQTLCDAIAIAPAAAVAVLLVESSGKGFGPDGRMVIRFENHVFGRRWGHAGSDAFSRHFRFHTAQPWKQHLFCEGPGGAWEPCHVSQEHEWKVFTFARALHEAAALQSISMGLPQIMGFNHARIGYDSARGMFDRFSADVRYQLLGLFDFIVGPGTTSPMLSALQRRQFELFASFYNGPGQAARYGQRIQQFHDAFETL